ncbi:MAG: SDR family oxidoreductase [Armatimonadetes bacterium]|nr:SDR family oxidoreductase [Armatimonadota bacterium]
MKLPGIEGRAALVTGAANGIGAETARLLAEQGATVTLVDIDDEPGEALAERVGAVYRHVDIRVEQDVIAVVAEVAARCGGVDILVNNAAVDPRCDSTTVSVEFLENLFAVNLFAQILFGREVIPHMRRAGRGAIVNLTSLCFHLCHENQGPYAATKGGAIAMARTWARENGRHGIRSNALAPGWTYCERQRQWLDDPAIRADLMAKQCIPKLLMPEQVARVVVFLCSDAASGITGQTITVDHGWVFNG